MNASADVFEPGDHASTFGGNPFACRAGLTVATEIERRGLLTNVTARGEQLRDGLQELVNCFPEHLETVRGWGLLQGIVIRVRAAAGRPPSWRKPPLITACCWWRPVPRCCAWCPL